MALIAVNPALADLMKFMRAVRLDKTSAQLGKLFPRIFYEMNRGRIIRVHQKISNAIMRAFECTA